MVSPLLVRLGIPATVLLLQNLHCLPDISITYCSLTFIYFKRYLLLHLLHTKQYHRKHYMRYAAPGPLRALVLRRFELIAYIQDRVDW